MSLKKENKKLKKQIKKIQEQYVPQPVYNSSLRQIEKLSNQKKLVSESRDRYQRDYDIMYEKAESRELWLCIVSVVSFVLLALTVNAYCSLNSRYYDLLEDKKPKVKSTEVNPC